MSSSSSSSRTGASRRGKWRSGSGQTTCRQTCRKSTASCTLFSSTATPRWRLPARRCRRWIPAHARARACPERAASGRRCRWSRPRRCSRSAIWSRPSGLAPHSPPSLRQQTHRPAAEGAHGAHTRGARGRATRSACGVRHRSRLLAMESCPVSFSMSYVPRLAAAVWKRYWVGLSSRPLCFRVPFAVYGRGRRGVAPNKRRRREQSTSEDQHSSAKRQQRRRHRRRRRRSCWRSRQRRRASSMATAAALELIARIWSAVDLLGREAQRACAAR
mmetsp:Transcript_62117/g.170670  ORF Transcript_62117/g.170670 Transcript_62117/m.170670 type:complete len:274 (+) Transcript_62117:239-1060(+)